MGIKDMIESLNCKKILVTGATGLIGQALVRELVYQGAKVTALVRSMEKAKSTFGDDFRVRFIVCDVEELPLDDLGIEYIIHAACRTESQAFVMEPVETILSSVNGMTRVLEFARCNKTKGVIYLSSMEVYGTPLTDEKISEEHETNLNTMNVRSCYPESKRLCENLCASYYLEYKVPVKIARLTQTFGPGVKYSDKRVFAEFARCAIEGRDIILKTKGDTKRSYLYIDDAVSAILKIMQYGEIGEAYNVANEETYCTIYDMASLVAEKCTNNSIGVKIELSNDMSSFGYAPTLHMNLDCSKIRKLGWKPTTDLKGMYTEMIKYMSGKNND